METTSTSRTSYALEYPPSRSGNTSLDHRTGRPSATAEMHDRRRHNRKRTRSGESYHVTQYKHPRYSRCEYEIYKKSRPRYSSESSHHQRREKAIVDRHDVTSAPPIHYREYKKQDPRQYDRRRRSRSQDDRDAEFTISTKHEPPPTPTFVRSNTNQYTVADSFIRSVSGTYKMMNRAEDRKRILSNQLPSCIKSKSIANSFIFCTSADGDALESEIASMRRHQKQITDFSKLDRAIHGVNCRVRKRPSPNLTEEQIAMIRAVRIVAIAFNRITYVARIKHYCDKDSRFSNYLRDQLTKRCSEGSRLNQGIRRFIGSVNVEKHRDLCLIFVGMICQTPHMWARSIRLLFRLKVYFQNVLIKMFADEHIDMKEVFELQYHSTAHKLLTQVRQYTSSAFVLNDAVATVVNMIRQRQSIPGSLPRSSSTHIDYERLSPPKTPTFRHDRSPIYPDADNRSIASSEDSSQHGHRVDSTDSGSDDKTSVCDDSDSGCEGPSTFREDNLEKSSSKSNSRSSSPSTSTSSDSSDSSSSSSSPPSLTFSPHTPSRHSTPDIEKQFDTADDYTHDDREQIQTSIPNVFSVHINRSPSPTDTDKYDCINIIFETT
nr:protein UL34 [Mastomys natalensis cytomegalovirus 3]WEG69866.1 protein UL34 [Mastomys natalensis cytomegalovirus 3]WEG70006.1 protein UL34 [Mastomys natalensis cytomegalovirus 3]WEG70146.1 protein UL34 [Mastomys natalensis cytomegalovirus 3]WEG70286.1 protein UL34 [Mastomys natalensis cytomegalovirus 3]